MNKVIGVLIGVFLILSSIFAAQPELLGEQRHQQKFITAPISLAKGILVEDANRNNSYDSKIAIISIVPNNPEINREFTLGLLTIGSRKFTLRNVTLTDSSLVATITQNKTFYGDLELSRFSVNAKTILSGYIDLSGRKYLAFYLSKDRAATAREQAQTASKTCRDNPQRCENIDIVSESPCDLSTESCRLRIERYCEENPRDEKCLALFRSYCLSHIRDIRCMSILREYCSQEDAIDDCEGFCSVNVDICPHKVSNTILSEIGARRTIVSEKSTFTQAIDARRVDSQMVRSSGVQPVKNNTRENSSLANDPFYQGLRKLVSR